MTADEVLLRDDLNDKEEKIKLKEGDDNIVLTITDRSADRK